MTPFFKPATRSANFGFAAPPTKIILERPHNDISFRHSDVIYGCLPKHLGVLSVFRNENDSDRRLECRIISSGFCYFRRLIEIFLVLLTT